jgi:2-dehydropantoate 2-reductase
MGCLFGARLAPLADVTLIGSWPEQIEALRRAPLDVLTLNGYEERVRLHATPDVDAVGLVDVALIMTKTPKSDLAAQGAARLLAPDGLAITLQNGLGNLEVLARRVGSERAALGVTTQGATIDGPGRLVHGGAGPTHLATHPAIDARLSAVAALFERAKIETHVVADVTAWVWGKLAINAAINPLTAILHVPNGALLESEWARRLMRRAAYEVATVAAEQKIHLPFDDAAARAEEVAVSTARNRSSMLQDMLRGVETEIEAICGAVVRAGESLGINTPANKMLYELVKALEETHPARLE